MNFDCVQFKSFIEKDCNRMKFIQDFLNKRNIDAPIIQLDGKNHVYVKFPLSQYNPQFKIKTVIAHYDRVENSPGANDNSSSVFCLLNWAEKLKKRHDFHNVRLIFTDGEELSENGVFSQGSYALALLFKKLQIDNDDVFVFDCMGRGDVPVLCENSLPKKMDESFRKKIIMLENQAERILSSSCGGKWLKLKTKYSDNAGFLVNGIPSVAFTLLPSNEATLYLQNQIEPETWKFLHTKNDNLQNLTKNSFELTMNILNTLADFKTFIG